MLDELLSQLLLCVYFKRGLIITKSLKQHEANKSLPEPQAHTQNTPLKCDKKIFLESLENILHVENCQQQRSHEKAHTTKPCKNTSVTVSAISMYICEMEKVTTIL